MSWRDHIKIHPAAELFPLLKDTDLRTLAEDIKANGLRTPVALLIAHDRLYVLEAAIG